MNKLNHLHRINKLKLFNAFFFPFSIFNDNSKDIKNIYKRSGYELFLIFSVGSIENTYDLNRGK